MNQLSVLAILLFAKNEDNENKKCLKQSKSKKADFFRPLSLFGIFGGMHSTDSCQKWREILGNRGINLQVFVCSCILCVPAIFQDVGSLRQNLDGQEIKKG